MNVGIVTCTRCERKESIINGVFKLIFIIQCDCSIKSNSPVLDLLSRKIHPCFFLVFIAAITFVSWRNALSPPGGEESAFRDETKQWLHMSDILTKW